MTLKQPIKVAVLLKIWMLWVYDLKSMAVLQQLSRLKVQSITAQEVEYTKAWQLVVPKNTHFHIVLNTNLLGFHPLVVQLHRIHAQCIFIHLSLLLFLFNPYSAACLAFTGSSLCHKHSAVLANDHLTTCQPTVHSTTGSTVAMPAV